MDMEHVFGGSNEMECVCIVMEGSDDAVGRSVPIFEWRVVFVCLFVWNTFLHSLGVEVVAVPCKQTVEYHSYTTAEGGLID